MFKNILIIKFIFLSILFDGFNNSLISDQKIYKKLQSDFICFRRFNGTHQFGCQSEFSGSVGTVHLVNDESDIDFIIKTGKNQPYIPCLRTKFFTHENINKFKNSNRIAGIVLFDIQDTDKLPNSLTEDRRCPNEMTSYYKDNPTYGHCKKEEWNKYATIQSLSELNLEFPMVLIRDQENITNIEKCFYKFNQKYDYEPSNSVNLLCSLQLETWMVGAKDSKLCMSRSSAGINFEPTQFCDSVSSYNIFSSLFKYEKTDKLEDRSIITLISKIDSLSIFNNAANGAQTTFSSLITFFTIMKMLSDQRDNNQLMRNGNVLYSLFDGEAFDYIGSGKTAFDLGTNGLQPVQSDGTEYDFKYMKKHLRSAIELNQLITEDKYYIHTDPLTRDKNTIKNELNNLINKLLKNDFIENVNQQDLPLPPSSVQQLLAHDQDLPVLVISNHKTDFTNKFYNSFLDDSRTIMNKEQTILNIAKLSESIAKSIISILNNENDLNRIKLNGNDYLKLIRNLYNCFIEDSKCKFFEDIRGRPSRLDSQYKTYPLYISTTVLRNEDLQPYHYEYLIVLGRLSSFLNGKNLENIKTKEQCDELNNVKVNASYEWFKISDDNKNDSFKTYCLETTKFYSLARSPVFLYDPPNWSLNYSTWTESVWNSPNVRLFVSSSKLQQYSIFITGLIIFLTSFFISRWINKNSEILFIDLRIDNNVAVSM